MKEEIEVWKDIDGYEGLYQVSNWGRIYSLPRVTKRIYHGSANKKGKLIKPSKIGKGYLAVKLYKEGIGINMQVHTIVAKIFIPNPNKFPQVNHINGIKSDNFSSNLEWCTSSMNTQHAYDTGLTISNRGVDCHNSRFTNADIINIRDLHFANGISGAEIARKYNVVKSTIYFILNRKTWSHV